MKTIYVSFSAPIEQHTTERLQAISFDAVKQGYEHIYYVFTTPGGQVANGIALYNTLAALQVKTTFHNIGNVDSIGNAIFLAGNERISSKYATFMFHGVGFDIQGARLEERQIREKLNGVLSDQERIGSIISEKTSLSDEKVKELFREASTKNSEFALENGIVHKIEELIIPDSAPVVQLTF